MRYNFFLFLASAVFTHAIFAQSAPEVGFPVLRTEHFEIHAAPGDAEILARQMEGRFAAYNQVFRFNPERLARPLRVRAFRDREQYERYVAARIEGPVPPGAVYLHFAQAELRELVIHLGNESSTLPFQAFIQFLRAFVPNPPAWIRDGFGVHFATLGFDSEGELTHRENLIWLDAVKAMPELPSPESIMRTLTPETMENFPGLAWSLVSFFLNSSNENYLRSLAEGFMMLSYPNTVEENIAGVVSRITMWNDMGDLARDHLEYLYSRNSFIDLIAKGQAAYIGGRPAEAAAIFRSALEIRSDHYAPWYYLGLMAYNAGDTVTAERYYRIALSFGADNASILFAMALNAATAGRTDEAIALLRQTAVLAPDRFGERTERLIEQLDNIRERR
ncbi:MAG: hypothetical protein FWB78_03870 [Treponema sp.]|nr:hypothetical protein [Treponema sp.]